MMPNSTSPKQLRGLSSVLALALSAGLTCAQTTPTATAPNSSGPTFSVKKFEITGQNPLSESEVAAALSPYVRDDANLESLQKAVAALEEALRKKGYTLHRVVLPPQDVGAVIRLNMVRFVLGQISVEGNKRYTEENIRASVPELIVGEEPNFRTLAVQTAIANEIPSKQIQVALRESAQPDRIDARVLVKESKPWNFALGMDNTGSDATGHDRVTLSGAHSNLFDRDHQLTAALTTSIENSSNVRQFGLNYRIPLYRQGAVVGLSYTDSDVQGDFGAFKSTGAGRTFGLNYSLYRPPEGEHKGFFSISLENKEFDVTAINGLPITGQSARLSRPLTLNYSERTDSDVAAWSYEASLAFNVSGGSGNELAAYVSEDPRISTTQWTALRGGANYSTTLSSGWLWSVRGHFQFSPDALISGEQFGLGGASSVRGTNERPIAGDSGVLLSTEITTRELAPGLRLLGFVDAGWLSNHDATANKPGSDSLSSVGLGLRYVSQGLTLSLDYGRIVSGSSIPVVPGSNLPQTGDEKLHLNLTARF